MANSSSTNAGLLGLPRTFWLLVAGMFTNRVGSFVMPFLARYLSDDAQFSKREVAQVLSAWGIGSVCAAVSGGQLADRWGRKPTMLLSLCGGAAVLAGLALTRDVVAFTVLAFALGAIAELYRPAVAATIADLTEPRDRARAFGYLTWAYNLGFAVSPLVAGMLAKHAGFTWLFVGDAATMLAAAVVLAIWVPETRPRAAVNASASPPARWADLITPLRDKRLRPLLCAAFLIGVVLIQFAATLGPMMSADSIDDDRYGQIVFINGLLIVLTQPWIVPRAERIGRARIVPLAAFVFCVGFALHGWVDTPLAHTLALCVWTAGEVVLFPLCNAIVADLAPDHLRGRYQGIYWMAWSSANVVGPVLGLLVLDSAGPQGWSAMLIVCGALATFALAVAARRTPELDRRTA